MVVKEKEALKALHRLLIQGRYLAGEGLASQGFFAYFDELEGLLGYVVAGPDDKSEHFETARKRACTEAQAPPIFEEFKRS